MLKRQREIPHHSELVEYGHAVAGHAGTMSDESGHLFFKPVHQQEVDFYESAFKDHQQFADIMPPFYGTLARNEPSKMSSESSTPTESSSTPEESSTSTPAAVSEPQTPAPQQEKPKEEWVPNKNRKLDTHQYLVLENASRGYTHANILDVKLGVRLWADDAPQAKKDRFDKISAETTHKNFGFRIAGMRIFDANASAPEPSEGKKPEFKLDGDYKVYDKDFGRNHVHDDNTKDTLKSFVFNDAAGIDKDLGRAVCEAFVHDLETIRDALENEESRMYSASCLFVFEGDGTVLNRSIKAQNARVDAMEHAAVSKDENPGSGVSRQDSGVFLEEGEPDISIMQTIGEDDAVQFGADSEVIEDEDEDEDEIEHRTCGVHLIDFAHAEWTPGQGPDQNSLKGVRNLISIFKELAA